MMMIVVWCALLWVLGGAEQRQPLRFRAGDGGTCGCGVNGCTFTVATFADIHFGEPFATQDPRSKAIMRRTLEIEDPDLVAFTGDQVTGNNIETNGTSAWVDALSVTNEKGYPWISTFGNHDDTAYEGNTARTTTTRTEYMQVDTSYALSYSQFSPPGVMGISNYVVPILFPLCDDPALLIYVMDSGGGTLPEYFDESQIQWYRDTSASYQQQYGKLIPAISIFHIELLEYVGIFDEDTCIGVQKEIEASPQVQNTGFFSAVQEMGDVRVIIVGHQHDNDFCCELDGIHLCHARHTGMGGYCDGLMCDRGSRIFQFNLTETSSGSTTIHTSTWVRMESLNVEHSGEWDWN
ncbi:metallophosphoesterase family protein [Pelomyxa schiedti]|nr:metallophosphoesterase family protein [Pelomyxa schiedti]